VRDGCRERDIRRAPKRVDQLLDARGRQHIVVAQELDELAARFLEAADEIAARPQPRWVALITHGALGSREATIDAISGPAESSVMTMSTLDVAITVVAARRAASVASTFWPTCVPAERTSRRRSGMRSRAV
jgi:broad specificity phosphatase PhoE